MKKPEREFADSAGRRAVEAWVFAGIWALLSIPMLLGFGEQSDDRFFVGLTVLMTLVFPGLLIMALIRTARWRRYGNGKLALAADWAVGQPAEGCIDFGLRHARGRTACITLTCMHHYRNRDPTDDNSQGSEAHWESTCVVPIEPGPKGSRVRFRFVLPPDVHATEHYTSGQFEWWLRAQADLPGPDLEMQFVVPVGKAASKVAADAALGR